MPIRGKVLAVNISRDKGTRKRDVRTCELLVGFGLKGDAHAAHWHRQVSLLAIESINLMREAGYDVSPGDFAENLTTAGLELAALPVGTSLRVGENVILRSRRSARNATRAAPSFARSASASCPNRASSPESSAAEW